MLILMQPNMMLNKPQFPTNQGVTNKFGATTYFAHETGLNKINLNGTEEPSVVSFNLETLIYLLKVMDNSF